MSTCTSRNFLCPTKPSSPESLGGRCLSKTTLIRVWNLTSLVQPWVKVLSLWELRLKTLWPTHFMKFIHTHTHTHTHPWCNSKQCYTTQHFLIECQFWQIHRWITLSSYIFYACKISRWSNINSHVINQLFKFRFL